MIEEFRKFVGYRVLEWFLLHPTIKSGINQLARDLGVSPASIKRYTDLFLQDGILLVRPAGTAHLFYLNDEDSIVRELKRVCIALLLRETGVADIAKTAISLVLYGSGANGTFDEKSDLDILVIAEESEIDYSRIPAIEEQLGHELQVTVIPYYRWEELKQRQDTFVSGVLARHVRLHGAEL
jgi:predicted nucleotidyltransferase